MKIAVDLDEVLGDFVGAFLRWHNHKFGSSWRHEDIVHYHLEDVMGIPREEERKRIHDFLDEEVNNILLVSGAKDAVAKLAQDHELYVISARHSRLRLSTEKWLEQYFPKMFQGLYLTRDGFQDGEREKTKGEICQELDCKLIIDDGSHHVEPLLDAGIRVIIFNHPWNIYHRFPPSVKRADNWQEIIGLIQEREKVNV